MNQAAMNGLQFHMSHTSKFKQGTIGGPKTFLICHKQTSNEDMSLPENLKTTENILETWTMPAVGYLQKS